MRQRSRGNSSKRGLDIYLRLAEGKLIRIKDEEQRFGVSSRSIKRDITEIRSVLANRYEKRTVVYDKKQNGYRLSEVMTSILKNGQIFRVCKVLLESGAFMKEEMENILDLLIKNCLSKDDQKLVSELIGNKKLLMEHKEFHFMEPSYLYKERLDDLFLELEIAVKKQKMIQITYQTECSEEFASYTVEPVTVVFYECAFYMVAYLAKSEKEKVSVNQEDDYPMAYRIDRIVDFQVLERNYHIPYRKRLEEKEIKKYIPFLRNRELMPIQLRYTGKEIDAISDRLPMAELAQKEENGSMIYIGIYNEEILKWILGQGEQIEVIKPIKLRNQIKEIAQKVLEKYKE